MKRRLGFLRMPMRSAVRVALLVAGTGVAVAGGEADAPLLHALFQDSAVLQRDQPIPVWGQAQPNQTVHVEFDGAHSRARADASGRWRMRLPARPAGGPYVLHVRAGNATQTIDDLLVGDVWLCSGQSNMELPVWRSLDARAEIAGAASATIRLLTVPQAGRVTAQENFAEPVQWRLVTSDSVRDFSAACYYFARELQAHVDVPMGLISAALGGSRIQAWTSIEALRGSGQFDEELAALALYATDPVAAAARWGEVWARWWHLLDAGNVNDEPWQPDYVAGSEWRQAPEQLGAWERWGVPGLTDYDGMFWYRTTVTLNARQAAQDAVLVLGPADEMDMSWVNGRAVGSTYGPGIGREYTLPSGLLRAGTNTVVINVLDTWRDGGLAGPASLHRLRLADGSEVALDRGWRYRAEPDTDWPPRAPWQSAAGLSTLYNGMIAPLGRYGLRGLLWYQGESNTFEPERYGDLLTRLRDDWRNQFGPELPLLLVQLAGFGLPPTQPGESGWAGLREAQRRVAADDPRTALVVTIDIGDRYDIHPPNKQELARRLARAARQVVYGETVSTSGPVPRLARREGDMIIVGFDDVSGGLIAYGADGPIGFELCTEQADTCRYATAQIRGDEVLLRAGNVRTATRVRHAWADHPIVTLFDHAGLPAGPFEILIP